MYLKQLEMQGFKSFPEKIRIKFDSGITAVVGPNGSGKSNIVDAIRWVLGEGGPKNLRSQKMEDVIFSGTQNRKQLSFAEVSLILDNEDKKLRIDAAEVTVTRRLNRSGDSDYLINGAFCRRGDIRKLFMDTGIGKEGYSIIGQGRIDEILSKNSEDRRMLFEEAAGIVQYKDNRDRAKKRLENERANLLRANDIISVLEDNMGPLEKAAEKAKKYIELAERLRLAEINLFVLEAKRFEEQTEKLKTSIEGLEEQTKQNRMALEAAEERKNTKKSESSALNDEIETLNGRITELKVLHADKLHEAEVLGVEINNLEKTIAGMGADRELAEKMAEEKRKESASKGTAIELKKKELEILRSRLKEAAQEYEDLRLSLFATEETIDSYNKSIRDKLSQSAKSREEMAALSSRIESIREGIKSLYNETATNEGLLNEKNVLAASLEKDISEGEKRIGALIERADFLKKEKDKLYKKRAYLEEKIGDISAEAEKNKWEIKYLSDRKASYELYGSGARSVLKNRAALKGICGAVGELIKVPKKYELAVETALGSSFQSIITEDENAAKEAVGFLKRTKSGRATFLPLSADRSLPKPFEKDITSAKGYISSARQLVECDPKYDNVISSLLSRTAVVDNMDNGTALAIKCRYRTRIVTLTGEVFNIGGSITGGSSNRKTTGVLSVNNRIDELKGGLPALETKRENMSEEFKSILSHIEKAETESEEIRKSCESENISLSSLRTRLKAENEIKEELATRLSDSDIRLSGLKNDEKKAKADLSALAMSLAHSEDSIEKLNEKLKLSRSENTDSKAVLEEKNNALTELQLRCERIDADLEADTRDKERLETEIKDILEGNIKSSMSAAGLREEKEQKKALISKKRSEAAELDEKSVALENEHKEKRKKRYELESAISEADSEIKDLNDILLNLGKAKSKDEESLSNLREKHKALDNSIWESYEITYPQALREQKLDMSYQELGKLGRELRAKIKALGSINASAPEEYAEAKEKYDFLTGQRADIEKAEKDLLEMIDIQEDLMKKQFTASFAEINKNFKVVFKEMFGGGRAEIRLSDEDDVLNSGIEIIAEPPGKKLQNMLLLSGGERSLTAMALLFAILKMKPSPFCLLDEIDAALDDANVTRYAKYIKRLSDTTQFVIITHRKGTMEDADYLYGITMQEQGISKIVSVSLKEADSFAE